MAQVDYDCVVVGGGVAGLSAAIVLGRARRRTLVLDRGQQSNRAAAHVGGLLGHDGIPPDELYELARAQVGTYEVLGALIGWLVRRGSAPVSGQ
jgi:thioredoxin reductase